jgi:twitching motility protein PilU
MDISHYLKLMVDKEASDLFFSPGAPINIKIEGITSAIDDSILPPGSVKKIAYAIMSEEQQQQFEENLELDIAVSITKIGRFRVNVFKERGEVAMVVRYIKNHIPSIEELNLPTSLRDMVMEPRGLILLVGTTGCGKSTTLASMIDFRNEHQTGHILTIEDPIEYIHSHKKSIVNQREVGLDTLSYANALRRAMREAPDVILIGEIRDRETMEQALGYADTGHLCLSTLHATSANQALERIINFFPESAHDQLYLDLSMNLNAIIGQRLIRGKDGKRLPAVEIMQTSSYVKELIQKHEIDNIKDAMEQSSERGMQTFDQSLYGLYKEGKITQDEALKNADSKTNLGLRIRLDESGTSSEDSGLHMKPDELEQ